MAQLVPLVATPQCQTRQHHKVPEKVQTGRPLLHPLSPQKLPLKVAIKRQQLALPGPIDQKLLIPAGRAELQPSRYLRTGHLHHLEPAGREVRADGGQGAA